MGRPGLGRLGRGLGHGRERRLVTGSCVPRDEPLRIRPRLVSVRSSIYLPICPPTYLPIYPPPATPSEESSQLCSRIAPHLQPCVVGAAAVRGGG